MLSDVNARAQEERLEHSCGKVSVFIVNLDHVQHVFLHSVEYGDLLLKIEFESFYHGELTHCRAW